MQIEQIEQILNDFSLDLILEDKVNFINHIR